VDATLSHNRPLLQGYQQSIGIGTSQSLEHQDSNFDDNPSYQLEQRTSLLSTMTYKFSHI
jgi:hypothetical protein